MDERRINIDEFFRRQLNDRPETPPPAVWEALEERLDDRGRKKAFPVWWFWTIAGILFISASVMIAGNMYKPQVAQQDIAHNMPLPASKQELMPAPSTASNVKENISTTVANRHDIQDIPTVAEAETHLASSTDNVGSQPKVASQPQGPASASQSRGLNNEYNDVNDRGQSAKTNRLRITDTTNSGIAQKGREEKNDDIEKVTAEASNNDGMNNDNEPVVSPPVADLLASLNVPPAMYNSARKEEGGSSDELNFSSTLGDDLANAPALNFTDTSKKTFKNNADTAQSELEKTVPLDVPGKVKKPLPIQFGLKAGYVKGFDNTWRADKFLFAPYLEYGLSRSFSVVLQPSVQLGKARSGVFANSNKSYYEITKSTFDSTGRVARGYVDSSILTPNPPDTIYRTYKYGQYYDSIRVGYRVTQNQVVDIELPVMLKYKVNKTFSVLVGMSGTYTSAIQAKEEVQRYSGLSKTYTEDIDPATFYVTKQGQLPPDGPARKEYADLFSYNTDPLSMYQPRATTKVSNFFRYGFMIGASANITQRWMIDVLIHKTGVDKNAVPDKELQKIYNQPYVRVLLGYRLGR